MPLVAQNDVRCAQLIPARAGIGLRHAHQREILETRPPLAWLEVHSENYMAGGAPLHHLRSLRADYPLSLHGVGLSLGSAGPLDAAHLARLCDLVATIEPGLVSEHLSWSVAEGTYLNDLLPLPYTEESLDVVVAHVSQTQDALRRRILIENPSSYLQFAHSTIPEWEFLAEITRRGGCGILLDVNNVYVGACNHGFDADAYLDAVPVAAVGEIHLAGHAVREIDGHELRIDDHGSAVAPPVWALYARALDRLGPVPTLIEWDSNIPALAVLAGEAASAQRMLDALAAAERCVPALAELQRALRADLLGADPPGAQPLLADLVVPAGLSAAQRLAVHRNNVLTSLAKALEETFPVIRRLVGESFFAAAAREFIRRHPPEEPRLSQYGAGFAAFLADFPPARPLAYLADVARLEWAVNEAFHAPDAVGLDPARLAGLAPEVAAALHFRLHPSCRLVRSPYPIERIWRTNQPDSVAMEAIESRRLRAARGARRGRTTRNSLRHGRRGGAVLRSCRSAAAPSRQRHVRRHAALGPVVVTATGRHRRDPLTVHPFPRAHP